MTSVVAIDRTCLCGKPHCARCGEVWPCKKCGYYQRQLRSSIDDILEDFRRRLDERERQLELEYDEEDCE